MTLSNTYLITNYGIQIRMKLKRGICEHNKIDIIIIILENINIE